MLYGNIRLKNFSWFSEKIKITSFSVNTNFLVKMVLKCDHCGELAVEEDEQVCSSCGIVIEDIQFGSVFEQSRPAVCVALNSVGASLARKSKPPIALTYGLNSLKNLCNVFCIPAKREYEATDILKVIYQSKRYKLKEDVGVVAGCCLFLLERKCNRSISVNEMCCKLECTRKKFSKFLKYVKTWLSSNNRHIITDDEENGFLSECQQEKKIGDHDLPEAAESLVPVICHKASSEEKNELMEKTSKLVKLAYDCWLFTGRSPRSVVVSCAFLCWKSMHPKRKKAPFTRFCSEFSIREPMAKMRIPELKEFLLKLGRKIPSPNEDYVNENNLLFHLCTILEYSKTLREDLFPDVLTEEAVNCKEYSTYRTSGRRLPRKESKSTVKYDPDMIASDMEISDTEIDSYLRNDNERRVIEELQNSEPRKLFY